MVKRWLKSIYPGAPDAVAATVPPPFPCTLLAPQAIRSAEPIEPMVDGAQLFVATDARPAVDYVATPPVDASAVACINIRSSNVSSVHEHNLKSLTIDDLRRDRPWHFDETLRSRPCMNLVPRHQLPLVAATRRRSPGSRLRRLPAPASTSRWATPKFSRSTDRPK